MLCSVQYKYGCLAASDLFHMITQLIKFHTLSYRVLKSTDVQSTEKLEYLFLVESTKIENASFPYKTAISEANVKTNRMMSITKNGVVAVTALLF